jgi:Icc-related predicted phosphoesterase
LKRLLVFSDVHTSQSACKRLVELSKGADIVLCAGDVGTLRRGIKKTIGYLTSIDKPTILVPGNAESYEELQEACRDWEKATVLHGNGIQYHGLEFYGIGGGIPITPFGSWSYDFTEKEAENLLNNCLQDSVLISHSPPKGILDMSSRGVNLGSTAVRNFIDAKSPRLVVCGHIHESAGKIAKVGNTTVINAGPKGVFYELQE